MRIKNSNDITYFIGGILLLLTLRPFFTWSLSGSYAQIVFLFPLAILFWRNYRMNRLNVLYLYFFVITLLLASISQNRNLIGFFFMIILAAVPFGSKRFMVNVFDRYKTLYSIIIGISILVWLLLFFGIPVPGKIIAPLNAVKTYNYIAYPFLVIPNYLGAGLDVYFQSLRFCGPFDEPGVVGTIAGLMLYIDNFNLKDKRNIFILISGLLSLSLFFYILSAIFLVYFLFSRNVKVVYKFFISSLMALLIVFSMQNTMTRLLIWDRLEYDKTQGMISGDNRADSSLKSYFNSIQGTSQYWWGVDNKRQLANFSDSAGYRNAILSNGAVVCIMYLLFFVLYALNRIKSIWYILIFITLLLATLYQRPGLFSVNYIFLFSMYIVMHDKRENIKLNP